MSSLVLGARRTGSTNSLETRHRTVHLSQPDNNSFTGNKIRYLSLFIILTKN